MLVLRYMYVLKYRVVSNYTYCKNFHTNKFLVFLGDLIGDALAPVGEVHGVHEGGGMRLRLLVVTYLHLSRECSDDRFEVLGDGQLASLDTISQVCEEGSSRKVESGRKVTCTCAHEHVYGHSTITPVYMYIDQFS